ncbi:MAG: hypothetical protein ACSHYA_05595 [Opitutaceae bacterium]
MNIQNTFSYLNQKQFFAVIGALLVLCLNVLTAGMSDVEENRMPFHAHLTDDFTPADEEKAILEGFRFVVLRPLDDGWVLGDFPRRGIYPVELEKTDIRENLIAADTNGDSANCVPRMSYFFANKIIGGESDWLMPQRSETVNKYTRWIVLYGNSEAPESLDAIEIADAYYKKLSVDERARTAVVYMDPLGDKENLLSLAERLKPSIQSMPGYLSRGYSRTLKHYDTEDALPVLVEIQSSGRVLSKHVGLAAIDAYFAEIQ